MNNTKAMHWYRSIGVITALALTLVGGGVDAQGPGATLAECRDAVMRRFPPPSESALAAAEQKTASFPGLESL